MRERPYIVRISDVAPGLRRTSRDPSAPKRKNARLPERSSRLLLRTLAAAAAARRTRRDSGGLELLEVLEHADHRVARSRVRLVGDRAAEADAQLGAQLALDQAVGAERLLRIVVVQISFA